MSNKACKVMCAVFFVLGIAGTIVEFCLHDIMCEYDMNPLCFFWALKWAFLGCFALIGAVVPDGKD